MFSDVYSHNFLCYGGIYLHCYFSFLTSNLEQCIDYNPIVLYVLIEQCIDYTL